jgi:2-dehydropantoate 2-reductase
MLALMNSTQRIAIVGAGAIGTAFSYQLAQAGHDVTVVARAARLLQLHHDAGVVLADGRRAKVHVAEALDVDDAFDLVLVTVLAPQVHALLPTLERCAARRVMFMFNTFDPLTPLRDAVGDARFCFGFPGGVFSLLRDGRIEHTVRAGTTVTHAEHAALFTATGIPTTTTTDMHAWLRTHAALVVPLMAVGWRVATTGRGVSLSEAVVAARAWRAGFALVQQLGHRLEPAGLAVVSALPIVVSAVFLWAFSRTQPGRELGLLGPHEAQMLVAQMTATAGVSTSTGAPLRALAL